MRALHRTEDVERAVQNAAAQLVARSATALARGSLNDTVVHDVRTGCKQLRALLRLLRPTITRSDYKKTVRHLRSAAHALSVLREARVVAETFGAFRTASRIGAPAIRTKRLLLQHLERIRSVAGRSDATRLHVLAHLDAAAQILELSANHPIHWKQQSAVLEEAYRNARHAHQRMVSNRSGMRLHDTRKRSKDLLYLCTFLRRSGTFARRCCTNLQRLTQYLGDERDLQILRRTLRARSSGCGAGLRQQMNGLIHKRRQRLRAQAMALGDHFYETSPKAFVTGLHRDWQAWRRH